MSPSFLAGKPIDFKDITRSLIITTALFVVLLFAAQAYAGNVTLSVVVTGSITSLITTNNFPNATAGAPVYATSTISVITGDINGWNVSLYGDNKNSQPQNNLQSGIAPATSTQITDQTEWNATSSQATTTPGSAVIVGSFINSGNVLAFRVMSASSTNGATFLSTTWWGTDDTAANAKWAGIASTTALFPTGRIIGNSSAGYSASAHLNTVQYYLSVSSTTQSGTYTAPITFTFTANP